MLVHGFCFFKLVFIGPKELITCSSCTCTMGRRDMWHTVGVCMNHCKNLVVACRPYIVVACTCTCTTKNSFVCCYIIIWNIACSQALWRSGTHQSLGTRLRMCMQLHVVDISRRVHSVTNPWTLSVNRGVNDAHVVCENTVACMG